MSRTGRRLGPKASWIAAALLASACTALPDAPEALEAAPLFEFRLGAGDRIQVGVWGEKNLQTDLTLGPDGHASLPLVGDVKLAGMTLDEARVALAQRYRASYVDPVVSVALLEVRSHAVHVIGEVVRPGTVTFVQGATAMGAILAAGGHLPATANLSAVRIVRRRLGGAPEAFVLDVESVLLGQRADVWLEPGDLVYVPPRLVTEWDRWWRQAGPTGEAIQPPTAPAQR